MKPIECNVWFEYELNISSHKFDDNVHTHTQPPLKDSLISTELKSRMSDAIQEIISADSDSHRKA